MVRKISSQCQQVQRPHKGDTACQRQSIVPPTFSEGTLNLKARMANVSRVFIAVTTLHVLTLNPHNDIDTVLLILRERKLRHNRLIR